MDTDEDDPARDRPTTRPQRVTYSVDPARLQPGSWSDRRHRFVGKGDIAASYSADKISAEDAVRRPFEWRDQLWVAVQVAYRSRSVEAYRLVAPEAFDGEAMSLEERLSDGGDRARADLNGFYHGIGVSRAGGNWVLCGPPARFVAGRTRQLSLFEDA